MNRAILWGGIAAIAFTTLGALASRVLDFDYGKLNIGSIAIYALVGIYVERRHGLGAAALAGLAVGAVDATFGWAISWAIGPGRPSPDEPSGPAFMVIGPLVAMVFAAIVAATSGVLASLIRSSRSPAA